MEFARESEGPTPSQIPPREQLWNTPAIARIAQKHKNSSHSPPNSKIPPPRSHAASKLLRHLLQKGAVSQTSYAHEQDREMDGD